ncbi:MAG TPA: hypothetical protein VFT99_01015, partial [Roseiflexaceae bacterium]|nr:hypothetical protein [Roseiflexaceae bacterium]
MRTGELPSNLTDQAATPHSNQQAGRLARKIGPTAAILALAAVLLLLADALLLWWHSGVYRVPIGNFRDRYFLEGAYPQETAPDGTTYRWTQADSRLWLNEVGVGSATLLELNLGGRPSPADLALTLQGQPWLNMTAATAPRRYTLLLPPGASGQVWVGITSPTFQVPGDQRRLGFKFEQFAIRNLHAGLPLPPTGQYLVQLALLVAVTLTVARLAWRPLALATLLAALAVALAVLLSTELLLAWEFLPRLAIAAGVLALLTWVALPIMQRWLVEGARPGAGFVEARELRILWALMLAAIAIRWVGVLNPSFGGQDLGRNLDRLLSTMVGQLYIIAPSGEFAKGLTIYPTGPYLALMPLYLLTADMASIMQGGLALMDGATALLVALLAYQLGGGKQAARVGLVLYAGNIAAFSAMSYSFSAQIFGQWFTAPLALLLLCSAWPPRRVTWLLAMILMSCAVFSHIGVALLAIGWMGLTLLLLTLTRRRVPWWAWAMFGAAGLIAFGFLYIEIVADTLRHATESVVPRSVGSGSLLRGWRILLLNGLRIGYSDIGLALLPFGLALFIRAARQARDDRWIVPV